MAMRKNTNFNHPKKGSSTKVEPIKSLKDIETIKKLLTDKPRDLALFVIGINWNLRASDLRQLKVSHVKGLSIGDSFEIKEQKTKKHRRITLNKATHTVINQLLDTGNYTDDDHLFKSKRADALSVPSINYLVKSWCKAINLKGNYGSHTLRKTWGYHQRVTFGVDVPTLMICLNHHSPRQTVDYLCIQPDEIKSVYENEL